MPVGLCGEFSRISRVRLVTAARSSSRSGRNVGGAERDRHPDRAGHGDAGRVGVVVRLERDHLVARLDQGEQRRGDRLGGARR